MGRVCLNRKGWHRDNGGRKGQEDGKEAKESIKGRDAEELFPGGKWTAGCSQLREVRGRFAEVHMKDASCAEWALGLGKIKMWKLKWCKFFLRRLLDLERVMEQEGEPEETVKITRVEMSQTLVEEMACEEMKVVEGKEGTKQRVRWADIEDEHETREERSRKMAVEQELQVAQKKGAEQEQRLGE